MKIKTLSIRVILLIGIAYSGSVSATTFGIRVSTEICSLKFTNSVTLLLFYPDTSVKFDSSKKSSENSTAGAGETDASSAFFNVFIIPEKDLIVIQIKNLNTEDLDISLNDDTEKLIKKTTLYKGSTIASFETQTLYGGDYTIKISDGTGSITKKIVLLK